MSISEADRHRLYEHLREILDDQDANTLMEHLPPGGWAETATTSDLATFQSLTQADLEALRVEVTAQISGLRSEVQSQIAELDTRLTTEVSDVRTAVSDLRSEMHQSMSAQTRTMVLAFVASNATVLALAFAAVRLG